MSHHICDALAGASDVALSDQDLDPAELGGVVGWTAPSNNASERGML